MQKGFWLAAALLQLAAPVAAAGAEAGTAMAEQPVPPIDPIGLVMVLLGLGGVLAVRMSVRERHAERYRPANRLSLRPRVRRFSQP
jgi:hypothetical protein